MRGAVEGEAWEEGLWSGVYVWGEGGLLDVGCVGEERRGERGIVEEEGSALRVQGWAGTLCSYLNLHVALLLRSGNIVRFSQTPLVTP